MWQSFERGVVLEREMHAFVGFNKDEDFGSRANGHGRLRHVVTCRDGFQTPDCSAIDRGRFIWITESDPVRLREAVRVALPIRDGRDVVRFSGHPRFLSCFGGPNARFRLAWV